MSCLVLIPEIKDKEVFVNPDKVCYVEFKETRPYYTCTLVEKSISQCKLQYPLDSDSFERLRNIEWVQLFLMKGFIGPYVNYDYAGYYIINPENISRMEISDSVIKIFFPVAHRHSNNITIASSHKEDFDLLRY